MTAFKTVVIRPKTGGKPITKQIAITMLDGVTADSPPISNNLMEEIERSVSEGKMYAKTSDNEYSDWTLMS